MIVEDDVIIAMDLENQLNRAGHSVIGPAISADEALELAAETNPDVVLMDLRLADGSSGIDACQRLYDDLAIRCIFISGNLTASVRSTLEAFEPYAMLSKPINPTQLTRAISLIGHPT